MQFSKSCAFFPLYYLGFINHIITYCKEKARLDLQLMSNTQHSYQKTGVLPPTYKPIVVGKGR